MIALANAFEAQLEHPSNPRYRFYCSSELELASINDLSRRDSLPVDIIQEALNLDWLSPTYKEYWTEWFGADEHWRWQNQTEAYCKARDFAKNYLTLELVNYGFLLVGERIRLRLHSRNRAHKGDSKLLLVGTIEVYPVLEANGA